MNPFYFRNSGKSLFGIYHAPSSERPRDCGVVICHPIGHEYIHGYRALRQLGHQLARAGFAVLRFDYYGCGDSAGDALEATLTQWMSDIETAVEEIRLRDGLSRICLVGARVGAALSYLVGSRRSDIDALVLWDAVVNGKVYLNDLVAQHQEWLKEGSPRALPFQPANPVVEVLGFPINPALGENLEQINLLDIKNRPARRVLLLETERTHYGTRLMENLQGSGADAEYQHIAGPRVWLRRRAGDNVVVPAQTLRAIVAWLSGMTE